jgi:hypothetical protein
MAAVAASTGVVQGELQLLVPSTIGDLESDVRLDVAPESPSVLDTERTT